MTNQETLELALDALQGSIAITMAKIDLRNEAIKALEEALKQEQGGCEYAGNGTAGIQNETKPTGFFFQMPKQEQGEPVAWESVLGAVARGWCYEENANKTMDSELAVAIAKEVHALYTTPQQRKPLTDEQLEEIAAKFYPRSYGLEAFARAIEAAHGIKEKNNTP